MCLSEPDHPPLYSTDESCASLRRSQSASRPILLADTQDNPGAGGSADTVGVLEALLRNRAERAVLGVLQDPEAARAAHGVGPGKVVTVGVGAKSGGWGEKPVVESWTVESLGDGRMTCHGPMMTNWKLALGPMALLRSAACASPSPPKKSRRWIRSPSSISVSSRAPSASSR